MAFGLETGPESVVNIKVIGVGGGGNNVVNRMVRSGRRMRCGEMPIFRRPACRESCWLTGRRLWR